VKLHSLLAHLVELETAYASQLRQASRHSRAEHDVHHQCSAFAETASARARTLEELASHRPPGAGAASSWHVDEVAEGAELLERLRGLYLIAQEVAVTWTMVAQGAKALRDSELETLATDCFAAVDAEAKWFLTRIKTGAPQALTAARA